MGKKFEDWIEEVLDGLVGSSSSTSDGNHRHQCELCKCVWEHPDYCWNSHFEENHACPNCGEEEGYKYHGKAELNYEFVSHGQYKMVKEISS